MLNRLSALHRCSGARTRGFTLIELMIALTLLGVLLTLAAPSFTTWINNTRVRTVSDVLQNGVRLAQAEAVRRNRTVVFFLTDDDPADDDAAAAENGANWGVRTLPLLTDETAEFVRGGPLSDAEAAVTVTGPSALCFNAAGQQVSIASQGCDTTAARYGVNSTSADRRLRVDVSIGGRVRMCDPAKTLSATAPDGCEA